jgi:hypothetical protein
MAELFDYTFCLLRAPTGENEDAFFWLDAEEEESVVKIHVPRTPRLRAIARLVIAKVEVLVEQMDGAGLHGPASGQP